MEATLQILFIEEEITSVNGCGLLAAFELITCDMTYMWGIGGGLTAFY